MLIPKYNRDWQRLPIKFEGEIVGYAEPDNDYNPLDPAGAKEQARRTRIQRQELRALGRAMPQIDAIDDLHETNSLTAKLLPQPQVKPPVGRISASDEQAEIAKNVRMSKRERKLLEMDAESSRRRLQREHVQALLNAAPKAVNE